LSNCSSTLDTEKASRTDLEMYVGVLNTQKMALLDDNDKLRARLNEGYTTTATTTIITTTTGLVASW